MKTDFMKQWAPIDETERFWIHRSGVVIDAKRERQMAQTVSAQGYLTVCGGRLVHNLLLEAFVGPRPSPKHVARHLNDIPTDNRLCNLAWGTRRQNLDDAIRNGRLVGGQAHSKVSFALARQIRAYRTYGFKYRELAEMFDIPEYSIGYVVRGEAWVERAS